MKKKEVYVMNKEPSRSELNKNRLRPHFPKWSSYRVNALGAADQLITRHLEYHALGITSEQKQQAYQALFRTHLTPETLHEVRTALNSELVTGTDRFKTEIERALGRRLQPKPRGRPRKPSDINLPKERHDEQLSFVENL
ncbi:hypothetical protein MTYP_02244 [Methylophilaceae bacterium]|nr:hypothetical protein MTYP_02244 [Methylophilaceae bacterium]